LIISPLETTFDVKLAKYFYPVIPEHFKNFDVLKTIFFVTGCMQFGASLSRISSCVLLFFTIH